MMRLWSGVLLIALLAAALVGCGGDDDDDDDEPATVTTAVETAEASGTAPAGTFTADQLREFGTELVNALASDECRSSARP